MTHIVLPLVLVCYAIALASWSVMFHRAKRSGAVSHDGETSSEERRKFGLSKDERKGSARRVGIVPTQRFPERSTMAYEVISEKLHAVQGAHLFPAKTERAPGKSYIGLGTGHRTARYRKVEESRVQ